MKTLILIIMGFTNNMDSCSLPDSIEKLLVQQFQGIEIVLPSAIVDDWQDFLDSECPTVAKADFNGDQIIDFAFIATNTNPEPYQLIVAQSIEGGYEFVKLKDIGFGIYDRGLGFGIELNPVGQIHGINETVTIENVGILFTKFESSTSIIYFDGSSYKEIWISD